MIWFDDPGIVLGLGAFNAHSCNLSCALLMSFWSHPSGKVISGAQAIYLSPQNVLARNPPMLLGGRIVII